MNNDQARQYFKDKGLTYKVLTPYTVDLLINMIQEAILKMRKEYKDCILTAIKQHKHTKKQLETHDYTGLELTVDGTYFRGREAITFNHDGFIGFAGWACTTNTEPFISAFVKWCDEVAEDDSLS